MGCWFAESDALNNPWRHGKLESIQPSLALRADVRHVLTELKKRDDEHCAHVRRHGLGMALPQDLLNFPATGSEVLRRLRALSNSPHSLTLRWLPIVRKIGEEKRQQLHSHLKQVVETGERLKALPPDAAWEELVGKEPDFMTVAEPFLARLDTILEGQQSGRVNLNECWLRALQGATAENVAGHRQRLQQAQELVHQLATIPANPGWIAVQDRVPALAALAEPVLECLERLASEQQATLSTITQTWLPLVRGAGLEKVPRFEADCRRAVELAQLTARTLGDTGEPAQSANPDFVATATPFLERLARLRGNPPSDLAQMARCYLRALRREDDVELQKRATACREAIELARRTSTAALDPVWEKIGESWSLAEVESSKMHAEEFLLRCGTITRFLSGAFRRAKQELLRLRPNAIREGLSAVAASLTTYTQARQDRAQLVALNKGLVPDYQGSLYHTSGFSFPQLALEALETAIWLIRAEQRHPGFTSVLDEFFWEDGRAGQAEAALRQQVGRTSALERLKETNQKLVPELHIGNDVRSHLKYPALATKGLELAVWLARQEQTNWWMGPLLDEFIRQKGPARFATVKRLRVHLARVRSRDQLAVANRDLVLRYAPASDEASQLQYPQEALQNLEDALSLWGLARTHPWAAPLLEEALTGRADPKGLSLTSLKRYIRTRKTRDNFVRALRTLVPGVTPPDDQPGQFRYAEAAWQSCQEAESLRELAQSHSWAGSLLDALLSPEAPTVAIRALENLEHALQRCVLVNACLAALSALNRYLTGEGIRVPYLAIRGGESVADWTNRLESGLDGLHALINLEFDRRDRTGPAGEILKALEEYEKARAAGIKVPGPDGVAGDRHGDWWAALVILSAVDAWQNRCRDEGPILTRITPEVHAGKVEQLKDILARKRSLETQVICNRWLVKQQAFRAEAWNRMFQERNSKIAPSKSLREAVDLSWDKGLPALRPCWLVSPGAASQLFPLEHGLFDLVIFDEASQCPVEQAIPAIYRGKNLLVSGDEKQLPPTMFFSAGTELEEDEVEESEMQADDNPAEAQRRRERRAEEESLMACSDLLEAAIGKLKQLYLCVHYRSDHPALIEFSNRAFYKGQLEAPPARTISIAGARPVEYHAVNGEYADRTNLDEGREIVALLKRFWSLAAGVPTIGVVTFNQAQRELIEDLVEKECQNDEWFNLRFTEERDRKESNQDVGFFVKNLENVQGDERDVMLFSTTFGKDAQGRFYRRVGPVGIVGGHRRLNVAITRAKKQIIIVGSMPIEQIANRSIEVGNQRTPAGYLQLYLSYAQAISAGDEKESRRILDNLSPPAGSLNPIASNETPLEASIRTVVERWGLSVERGVGETGFRIDLAVRHPDPNRGYLLGIECDDGAWFGDRTARVRSVWRPSVLQRRGWRLHRIWSITWWDKHESEVRRLHAALEAAIR